MPPVSAAAGGVDIGDDLERGRALMRGNTLVYRFCLYGLLKNLKFFEPFLVTVLLKWGYSLTLIGALMSVEKVTCYVMELPSGYISDRWGARKTLCSCFLLYICSFLCYYFGQMHITFLVLASFFYGVAEAARSGAHKSMVFLWLEKHNLLSLKSYLNGRTRSFSLLGSALAAVGGIFLTLYLDANETIFLCSIPAYILDLAVVWSYPTYMDTQQVSGKQAHEDKTKMRKKKKKGSHGLCEDARSLWRAAKDHAARRAMLATASMGIMHRIFKDYVQPLVVQNQEKLSDVFRPQNMDAIKMNMSSTSPAPGPRSESDPMISETVILGVSYCIFYLISSPASRNAWRLPALFCDGSNHSGKRVMDFLMDAYAVALVITAVSLIFLLPAVGPFMYVLNYVLYNFHKPLSAEAISDLAGKRLRATVLSADAALQTLSVAIFAPLAGYLAETLSLAAMFLIFSLIILMANRLFVAELSLVNVCFKIRSKGNGGRGIDQAKEKIETNADKDSTHPKKMDEISITMKKGESRVSTIMGNGTIMQLDNSIRADGMVGVALDWKLAHGSRPVLYTLRSRVVALTMCMLLASSISCVDATAREVAPSHVYVYSLNYTTGLPGVPCFEHIHTVSALAGIVNRERSRLFTPLFVQSDADGGDTSNMDNIWRDFLTSKGEWLQDTVWLNNITTLEELVTTFIDDVSGVVLYDPVLPATSNLASTAAGVENLLPVLYRPGVSGSVYERLVATGPKLQVTLDLTPNGSLISPRTKVKAYEWARKRWLSLDPNTKVPQSSPEFLAYYVDLWAAQHADELHANPILTKVSNHDFFVSKKAFFFDLSVWADEKPVDDPSQPLGADRAEMIAIFEACYNLTNGSQMIHVGGFTPWYFKYTQDGPGGANVSRHQGVETEWETMDVIGPYNAFDDADACCVGAMANSAFYQHYPLPEKLKQNAKPTVSSIHKRGGLLYDDGSVIPKSYAMFYAGDYDGAAWLYRQLKSKWDDRGASFASNDDNCIPIGWAIDGELSLRFPPIFKYLYDTKGPCDFFISGDSGAGYLNPTTLLPSSRTGRRGRSNITKSGARAWIVWNTRWYSKFDVSFTGFLINGDAGPLSHQSLEMYRTFSPDGVVVSTDHDPHSSGYESENGGAWALKGDQSLLPVVHHVVDLVGPNKVDKFRPIVVSDRSKTDMNGRPSFYVLRTILDSAKDMQDIAISAMHEISNLTFVDPYTMGLLVKCMSGMDCSKKV